jgi:hypothetical protein
LLKTQKLTLNGMKWLSERERTTTTLNEGMQTPGQLAPDSRLLNKLFINRCLRKKKVKEPCIIRQFCTVRWPTMPWVYSYAIIHVHNVWCWKKSSSPLNYHTGGNERKSRSHLSLRLNNVHGVPVGFLLPLHIFRYTTSMLAKLITVLHF